MSLKRREKEGRQLPEGGRERREKAKSKVSATANVEQQKVSKEERVCINVGGKTLNLLWVWGL